MFLTLLMTILALMHSGVTVTASANVSHHGSIIAETLSAKADYGAAAMDYRDAEIDAWHRILHCPVDCGLNVAQFAAVIPDHGRERLFAVAASVASVCRLGLFRPPIN
ncbi:MAG TPA: hypothetical protein VIN77_09305 [Aurantimonas sp.]